MLPALLLSPPDPNSSLLLLLLVLSAVVVHSPNALELELVTEDIPDSALVTVLEVLVALFTQAMNITAPGVGVGGR